MLSSSLEKMQRLNNIASSYASSIERRSTPSLSYPDDTYEFSTHKTEDKPKVGFGIKLIRGIANLFSNKADVVNKPVQISPTVVPYSGDESRIIDRAITSRYVDWDNGRILSKLSPAIMKYKELPADKKLLEVSNFEYPRGTIMATTTLDECIASGKFLQCAGLVVVDKAKNQQTLMHCYPGNAPDDVYKLLKHIIDNSSDKLDITIIPGAYDNSEETISYLVDSLKELTPDNEVKFANFSKDVKLFNRAVLVENGKLSCCTNEELENNRAKITNPLDRISYIEHLYNMKK